VATEEQAAQGSGVLEDGSRATPPSQEEVAKAEAARKELGARGYDVSVKTFWWGFEIHLNAEAAALAGDIAELIGDVAGEALPSPMNKIVEAYCKIKALWIKEVGNTYGCKLVSPWIAPGMLIPISLKPNEDTNLWWTVYETREEWSKDEKFTAHHSASNPALAEHQGKLYCAHRGSPSDSRLWWTVYDPDKGWSEDTLFGAHSSESGPALASFEGRLHCVHRGSGNDKELWHTTFDPATGRWSADTPLGAHSSSVGPALAVFGNKLHCVHRGSDSAHLWHTTWTPSTGWTRDVKLNVGTSANPALAVYDGRLHCVYRGNNTTALQHISYSTSAGWGTERQLDAHHSLEGPGLAVFDSKLYCIHRGHGGNDQKLWWATYTTNGGWSTDKQFPAHSSGAGPAVIAYRDKYGDKNQLLVVHRGYGNRAAGTDTAEDEARLAGEQRAWATETATS
jgi:hypothetical protein